MPLIEQGEFPVPQVSTDGMSDAEKAKVPPINRMFSPPTETENRLIQLMLKGMGGVMSPEEQQEYETLRQAIGRERS